MPGPDGPMRPVFYISRVRALNFRNFEDLDVELGRLNVVIGHNAAGKSNFLRVFSFLRDIVDHGLGDAISYQGGRSSLLRFGATDGVLAMEFHFAADRPVSIFDLGMRRNGHKIYTDEIIYKFEIKFDGSNYEIRSDELKLSCFAIKRSKKEEPYHVLISGKTGKISTQCPLIKSDIKKHIEMVVQHESSEQHLILESRHLITVISSYLRVFLSRFGIYDFDSTKIKTSNSKAGPLRLLPDGSNLSIVMRNIESDKKAFDELILLLRDTLPFIKNTKTEISDFGGLELYLQETYSPKYLHSVHASDGTMNVLAMLICLFTQDLRFTTIEEPERSLHPGLLSFMVQLMDESSETNQIVITTHNPDILGHAPSDSILLIKRAKNGNSAIIRAPDDKMVKKFQNELTVSKLMRYNML